MRVLKSGEVVEFICDSCGCVFVAGINSIERTTDGNCYCRCPMCGADCHTDVSKQPNAGRVTD